MGAILCGKIIYGWKISDDDMYDYHQRCEANEIEEDGMNDFLQPTGFCSYEPDNYFYGVEITRTWDCDEFDPCDLSEEAMELREDWIECYQKMKRDFPEIIKTPPKFYLVCQHWA